MPGTLSDAASTSAANDCVPVDRSCASARARRDAAWRREQRAAIRIADQAEHQVPMGIEVVHHEEQLAEAGLAEVLGEQLRIPAAQILGLPAS